ncbi:MAG: hypothetical protein IPF55_11205 [Rhodoferax sp.]|nr:hypothetical protein [Rhodoferax sp.]
MAVLHGLAAGHGGTASGDSGGCLRGRIGSQAEIGLSSLAAQGDLAPGRRNSGFSQLLIDLARQRIVTTADLAIQVHQVVVKWCLRSGWAGRSPSLALPIKVIS